ncbi:MAG: hypothetical protein DMG16_15190 [Acidobacteria bacterium]|nr:MAG: hypothetical protein DMG16_15190 [Acidobacteriota bacterium]
MESDFLYPTSLLRALNQWQKGGDAAAKATRGRDLKERAQALDNPIFRQCNAMVYPSACTESIQYLEIYNVWNASGDDFAVDRRPRGCPGLQRRCSHGMEKW